MISFSCSLLGLCSSKFMPFLVTLIFYCLIIFASFLICLLQLTPWREKPCLIHLFAPCKMAHVYMNIYSVYSLMCQIWFWHHVIKTTLLSKDVQVSPRISCMLITYEWFLMIIDSLRLEGLHINLNYDNFSYRTLADCSCPNCLVKDCQMFAPPTLFCQIHIPPALLFYHYFLLFTHL